MDLQTSYQHCLQLARDHYENFPTASRLIQPDLRPAVAAIYAFARSADDIADEGDDAADKRLKQLDAWEVLLDRCSDEELDHPVFTALGDTIRRHKLPVSCLRDLLTAFRMDVSIHAYKSLDELLFYCRHSANPVGRLMLALHHIEAPEALRASDAICTALQLANFWQDLSRDIPNRRCYLPDDWLHAEGLDSNTVLESPPEQIEENIAPVIERAVLFTENLFAEGKSILPFLPLRLRLQIAATMRGGRSILKRTDATALRRRPSLTSADWLKIAPLALSDAVFSPRAPRRDVTQTGSSPT